MDKFSIVTKTIHPDFKRHAHFLKAQLQIHSKDFSSSKYLLTEALKPLPNMEILPISIYGKNELIGVQARSQALLAEINFDAKKANECFEKVSDHVNC